MYQEQLDTILRDHAAKLSAHSYPTLELERENLGKREFCLPLEAVKFNYCNLVAASFCNTELIRVHFWHCDLSSASFRELKGKNLRFHECSFQNAHFYDCEFDWASFMNCDFTGAQFIDPKFHYINWSGAKGLLDPTDFILSLEHDDKGVYAYKVFDYMYAIPKWWRIEPGSIITEAVNYDRFETCGCGINVATPRWLAYMRPLGAIWKVRIRWEWLASVVVPISTDGTFRAGRVELIDALKNDERTRVITEGINA